MNPNQASDFGQDTYRTGSTQPPKSHGGLIAFLLVLVIFLCGVSTALGLMNIRLSGILSQSDRETSPMAFSGAKAEEYTEDIHFLLGFSGQEIPEIWCLYQDLPRGIYITNVTDHSDAAAKGVLPGDILLCVDGQDIPTTDQLSALLAEKRGQSAQVILYRDGKQLDLTLAIEN